MQVEKHQGAAIQLKFQESREKFAHYVGGLSSRRPIAEKSWAQSIESTVRKGSREPSLIGRSEGEA